jgi:regulator of cell morphogenesis and NO signaling
MTAIADKSVREIALENPASARVFESLGIDYCCGGKVSPNDACMKANLAPETVLQLLENLKNAAAGAEPEIWVGAPFAELTGHIVAEHHGYIRNNAPRLLALLQKVDARHGAAHPEIAAIQDLFVEMHRELVTHMLKEEQVLFPYLCSMDTAVRARHTPPQAFFGSVQNPIAHMLTDHDAAGDVLERMSALSNGYRPPPDACPTYTALYHGLAEFERDLHRHVHLENNILFPRHWRWKQQGSDAALFHFLLKSDSSFSICS